MSDFDRLEQKLESNQNEAQIYRAQILEKLAEMEKAQEREREAQQRGRDEMRQMHSHHYQKAEDHALKIQAAQQAADSIAEDFEEHVEHHKRWIVYVAGISTAVGVVANLLLKWR